MQQISSIKKGYQKLNDFIMIYSFLGYFLLALTLGGGIFFLKSYLNGIQLLQDAEQGSNIINEQLSLSFSPILITLIIAILFYIELHTIIGLFLRRKLKKIFKESAYTFEVTNEKLIIKISKSLARGFLYTRAFLSVYSETENNKQLSFELSPITHMSGDSFAFSIKNLPTGKYHVEKIRFALVDPMQMFDIKASFNLPKSYYFTTHKKFHIGNIYLAESSLNDKDGRELVYEKPDDSFFSIREYMKGDALKKIHWKNSAKHKKFFVKMPEERYVEHTNIDIAVNLYAPTIQKIDYKNALGDYLSIVQEIINIIAKEPTFKIRILINSKKPIIIDHVESQSLQYIRQQIINKAVFQSERTMKEFFKEYPPINPILVTLPLDNSIVELNCKKTYIINLGRDLSFNVSKKAIKDLIFSDDQMYRRPISIRRTIKYFAYLTAVQRIQLIAEMIVKKVETKSNVTFINAD